MVHAFVAALFACTPVLAAQQNTGTNGVHEHTTNANKARSTDAPFGREGDPRKVQRVIRIDMSDAMRYFPDQIRVKRGATVRFVIRNGGKLPHEMVLGTMDALKQHATLMRQSGSMDHEEPNMAHVAPGSSGRLVWQFTKSGEFYYGCLIPGHFEAGMIGTVVVR
ncbi:MAG: cupredoxin domain-containing protein [Burkholderiales bacterium]